MDGGIAVEDVEPHGEAFHVVFLVYFEETMVPLLVDQIDQMRTRRWVVPLLGRSICVLEGEVHVDDTCPIAVGIDGECNAVVLL